MRNPNALMRAAATVATCVTVLLSWTPPAHAWTEIVLHRFSGGSDGSYPTGNLMMDPNGNLFGTTENGGGACKNRRGCGTVFKVAPDGTETVVYAFPSGKYGAFPFRSGLVEDQSGNLYGTTS